MSRRRLPVLLCAVLATPWLAAQDAAAQPAAKSVPVTLTTMARAAREGWCSFTVPTATLPDGALRMEPQGFPVVAGNAVGPRARMVHVRAKLEAGATIQGDLRSFVPAPDAAPLPPPPIWKDASVDPVPELFVGLEARPARWRPEKLEEIESDAARRVLKGSGRVPGTMLVAIWWFYLYSGQRAVPFELLLVNSDPRSQAMNQDVQSIGFETGYKVYAVVDYARRRGGQKPVERDGRWYTELVGKTWFGDGQGLAWRGRLLLGDDDLAEADKHSLRAEVSGPILGIARNWDGHWGPWGVTPRLHPGENTVSRGHGQVALFEAKRAFEAYLAQGGTPWDEVPLGLRFMPGMTGDQQDFGVTKLAPALAPPAGGPFHLWECAFSTLYEACRPTHYYEANAQRIRIEDHPNCVFWDQRPHWHTGVSPDRLGKSPDKPFRYQSSPPSAPGAPPREEQIMGKDFQHASSNTLCGYALLSGSWLDRELCAHEVEAHLLGQRIDRGREAERGIGRALLQVAWLWLVTGDERLIENERKRLEVHYNDFLDPGRKDWQVRVLTAIKDNRKLDGKYDCWMPWQTALCGTGLDAAGQIGLTKAIEINKILMRTLVFYGWWETPRGWGVGDAVRYLTGPDEGKALSAEAYQDESQASPHFGTGFHEWSWPAVIIARRYAQEAGDQAWLDRCDRILASLRRDYVSTPPKGFDRISEWTAVR